MTGQLLNATQAARYVTVSRSSFYTILSEGRIRAVRLRPGGAKRYRRADLDKYIQSLKHVR